MKTRKVVTRDQWLEERLKLLNLEKAHSKARDDLTQQRQGLPWVKVGKVYEFDSAAGKVTLNDLFGDKNQLIVHHFMFDPDWQVGCKSCSFTAEHYDRSLVHIGQRDTAFITVSRAPLEKLLGFRDRMGWSFDWVSSLESSFNFDFNVSFTQLEQENSTATYNYRNNISFGANEAPGISVFAKGDDGTIYHTYSVYSRGLEDTITAYFYLDLLPKGRDEEGLKHGLDWVKLRDEYEN